MSAVFFSSSGRPKVFLNCGMTLIYRLVPFFQQSDNPLQQVVAVSGHEQVKRVMPNIPLFHRWLQYPNQTTYRRNRPRRPEAKLSIRRSPWGHCGRLESVRRSDSCAYADQPLHRVILDDPVEYPHDCGPVALKSKFSRCRVYPEYGMVVRCRLFTRGRNGCWRGWRGMSALWRTGALIY